MSDTIVTDCEGILFDDGGASGNYSDSTTLTFTICPNENDVQCIRLTNLEAAVEEGFDLLYFYEGDSIDSAKLIGTYSSEPPLFITTNSPCITIVFQSDDSVNLAGFQFTWRCFTDICPPEPPPPISPQDCVGAIAICQDVYFEEEAYQGTGFVLSEINPDESCLGFGERNNVWYTFTVQQAGDLAFQITPNNLEDDYDWAVYNVTQARCSDIATNSSIEMSCNYSGTAGITGPTGATEETSAGGDGPTQNATIPVLEGETYVINVSQFSTSTNGYTIDFGLSTAVIFDNVPPRLASIQSINACGSDSIQFRFSENVLCSSVEASDFSLTDAIGNNYELTLNTRICAADGLAYERDHRFHISPPLTLSGDYFLVLKEKVQDICGNTNVAIADTLAFSLPTIEFSGILEGLESSNLTVCEGASTEIRVTGENTYHFYTQEGVNPANLLAIGQSFDPIDFLTIGEPYILLITQLENGCESPPITVEILVQPNDLAAFELIDVVCKNALNPIPILPPDVSDNGLFSISEGGIINEQTGEIDLANTPIGQYTVTYQTQGICPSVAQQNIEITHEPIAILENIRCSENGELVLLDLIASNTDNNNLLIEGDYNNQVVSGEIISLSFSFDINAITFSITDLETGCNTFLIIENEQLPACEPMLDCMASAGEMPTERQIVCFEHTFFATSSNVLLEEGMILAYVLHENSDTTLGNIIASSSTGEFTNNFDAGLVDFNTTYYLSALVGFDENMDGLPDNDHICTHVAQGTPIILLPPVIFETDEVCNSETGEFMVTVSISGGFPSFDPTAVYEVQGNFLGSVAINEPFTVLFPTEGDNVYQFIVIDDGFSCDTTRISKQFVCLKSPVELLSFEGEIYDISNKLKWVTASEINNDFFTLERSRDGISFEQIAKIKGKGNSEVAQTYEFWDKNTSIGTTYYRLKQTDYDGQQSYSDIIALIRGEKQEEIIQIYPIPAIERVYLQLNLQNQVVNTTKIRLYIYSITGEIIDIHEITHQNFLLSNEIVLPIQNYLSGIYWVKVNIGQEFYVVKFVKK